MSRKFIIGLALAGGLALGAVGSASASGWAVTIEHNPMSTACGSVTNIPVAGANSCPTAITAATNLFNTLLSIPGCLNVCPAGETPQLPLPTPACTPNGAPPRNWLIGVEFTCVKIGQRTIDLGIKKSGGGTVPVGGAVDFTLNTYNYGPSTVGSGINAVVTDTLPPGVTSVTVTAPGWHCTVIALSIVCIYNGPTPIGANQALPPISIHSTASAVGTYNNCANIRPVGAVDTNDENNRACAPFTVTDPPPPSIKGCLEDSKVAVTCNPDGTYTVTLSGGSFTGNTITLTSQTTGVTVTPPQQPWAATTSWIITGATAGQTVVLTANATKTGGGSVDGSGLCCSGEITIVMPECPKGTVVVEKKVKNDTHASTAAIHALLFPINLTCGLPSTINTTFGLHDGDTHTENNVPYGSLCSVTEPTWSSIPVPPDACDKGTVAIWLPPVITVTPSATVGAPVTAFTVVNELQCVQVGIVTVEKKVINKTMASNAAINALSFPIGLTCGLPSTLNVSFNLSNGGGLHTENNVPYGSLCSVTETNFPAAPPNACPQGSTAAWATPVITVTPSATVGAPTTAFTVVNELDCTDKPPVIDVGIGKTGGTTPYCPAPYYVFYLTATNVGNTWPATGNIVVTDVVPTGMRFDSATGTDWNCGTLPANAGSTITCTYTGAAPTLGQVLPVITINATALDPYPFPPYVNSASVSIPSSSGYVDTNPANDNATSSPVMKPVGCPYGMPANSCQAPFVQGPIPGQCICGPGTVLVGGECVKQPVCDPPKVPGPVAGQCICGQGYSLVGGVCVKQTVCDPPMVQGPVAGQCICGPGYTQRGSECVKQTETVCRSPAKANRRGGCDCPKNMDKEGNGCVPKKRQGPTITPKNVIDGIGIIRSIPGLSGPGRGTDTPSRGNPTPGPTRGGTPGKY